MKKTHTTFSGFLIMAVFLTALFPVAVFSQTTDELQIELKKIEAEIASYEKDLAKTKTEKNTLTNKINQLKKEQAKIALQIKTTNLQINEIGRQLELTELSIQETADRLSRSKERAGGILRAIHERNQVSLLEIMLGDDGVSKFFGELDAYDKLTAGLIVAMGETKTAKNELENKYVDLEEKRGEKKNLLSIQALQSKNLIVKTGEQNKILKETQGKEARYQAILADSKKKAQEIKSRIYELLGITGQVTFGEAVDVAKWASAQTGVRPAFLLAVLTQESDLGKNVGTCNRVGDPPSKGWRVIMKPERDHAPFLATTGELGMDPDITPVSCPMKDSKGNRIGWGGAMGPAQFIPSTWVLFKKPISAVTGKTPNPWDMRDAFLAAALLLKDNGAASGKSNAEWRAAMLYFSGSTNTRYRFYGDSVVNIANNYEDDIEALN